MKLNLKICHCQHKAKFHKTGFEDMTNFVQFSLICSILKYYANGSDCVGDDYSTSVFPASVLARSPHKGNSLDFNGPEPGLINFN